MPTKRTAQGPKNVALAVSSLRQPESGVTTAMHQPISSEYPEAHESTSGNSSAPPQLYDADLADNRLEDVALTPPCSPRATLVPSAVNPRSKPAAPRPLLLTPSPPPPSYRTTASQGRPFFYDMTGKLAPKPIKKAYRITMLGTWLMWLVAAAMSTIVISRWDSKWSVPVLVLVFTVLLLHVLLLVWGIRKLRDATERSREVDVEVAIRDR